MKKIKEKEGKPWCKFCPEKTISSEADGLYGVALVVIWTNMLVKIISKSYKSLKLSRGIVVI